MENTGCLRKSNKFPLLTNVGRPLLSQSHCHQEKKRPNNIKVFQALLMVFVSFTTLFGFSFFTSWRVEESQSFGLM